MKTIAIKHMKPLLLFYSLSIRASVMFGMQLFIGLFTCILCGSATAALTGPVYPPLGGATFSESGSANDGSIARTGGKTYSFSNVNLANTTVVYWGPAANEIKESFDDSNFTRPPTTSYDEVFSFNASLSNLASGIAVWTGETRIAGVSSPVYLRFILTATVQGSNAPIALTPASNLGLDASVGAAVPVAAGLAFNVNMLFLASSNSTSGFVPALEYFDAAPKLGPGVAYTSFDAGFYYNANNSPTISDIANQITNVGVAKGPIGFAIGDIETPAANLTLSGSSDNAGLVPNAGITFGGNDANRTITVTPAPGQTGAATITVTVSDGQATATDTFQLRVNSPPLLVHNNHLAVNQGATAAITTALLQATDANTAASGLVYQIGPGGQGGPPFRGTLRLNGNALTTGSTFTQDDIDNNRLTYQNDASPNTSDNFQFNITDSEGGVTPTGQFTAFSFFIDITLVNQPPVASSSSFSTGLGATLHANVTASDPDSTSLIYTITAQPQKGVISFDSSGAPQFTYTPNSGASGSDFFKFQVSDSSLTSAEATVNITIENQTPVPQGAFSIILQGNSLLGTLSASDLDQPPQVLTFSVANNPAHGQLTINDSANGTFTYVPDDSFFGLDSFTFTVSDGIATSISATVNVGIRPIIKLGHVLIGDAQAHAVALVDPATGQTGYVSVGGLLQEPHGVVVERSGKLLVIDVGSGLIRIDPVTAEQTVVAAASNFSSAVTGPLGVALEKDGNVLVADGVNGLVRVDVQTGQVSTLSAGSGFFPLGVAVADNGEIFVSDAAGLLGGVSRVVKVDSQTGARADISSGGNLVLPAQIAIEASGQLLVTSAGAFAGNFPNVLVRIDPETGNQTVLSTNNNLAGPIGLGLRSDGQVFLASVGNAKLVQVDPISGNQTVISGGGLLQQPFTATVVNSPTIAPVAAQQIDEDTTLTSLPLSVRDIGTTAGFLSLSAVSDNLSLVASNDITFGGQGRDRTISIKPIKDAHGTVNITITVSDGVLTSSRNFALVVMPINDAPTISPHTYDIAEGTILEVLALGVLVDANDIDGDLLHAVIASQPQHGLIDFNSDGSFKYTPAAHFAGLDSFTYRADDGSAQSEVATVHLKVHVPIPSSGKFFGNIIPEIPAFTDAGTLLVNITTGGKFTGSLSYAGKSYPLRGVFGMGSTAGPLIIKRRNLPNISIQLRLTNEEGRDQVLASLSVGVQVIEVTTERLPYKKKLFPAPQAGTYTLALQPDPNDSNLSIFPQGVGFARLIVTKDGSFRIIGALTDGTPISCAAKIGRDDRAMIYAALFAKHGYVQGDILFNRSGLLSGSIRYLRPSLPKSKFYPVGFLTTLTPFGNRYVAPKSGQAAIAFEPSATLGNIDIAVGNLTSNISRDVTLQPKNILSVDNPGTEQLKLKIVSAKGLLTGSFIHPVSNKKTILKGVIIPQMHLGAGFFLGIDQSGSFQIRGR